MKKKKSPRRFSPVAKGMIAIGVIAIWLLGFSMVVDYVIKNWAGYVWDKQTAEKALGISLPTEVNNLELRGHRGRGGKLEINFQASHESTEGFTSQFCEGLLYQGYDPFNAIDTSLNTKKPPLGAFIIKMNQVYPISYYSYSPDASDNLFGIRCLDKQRQIQILVDKTLPDVALTRMEVEFTCYKCALPEDPTPTKTKAKS